MATYREALHHARRGGTSTGSGKTIRFLTFEEAKPILLEQHPSRATRIGENGKPAVKNKKIVVDTFADPTFRLSRLGLHDVSVSPPVEFRPTADDIAATWQRQGIDDAQPEAVAPEVVDEVLTEEAPVE
jgi:hypothetical protein